MIDHISIQVSDLAASTAFYDAVLAPLGLRRMVELADTVGYGDEQPRFWLGRAAGTGPGRETHLAFSAADRATVVAFHDAAVQAEAEVLNAPRVWPEYHPSYFGAFVRDPDGNNVEAVCHVAG
ncbi:VOC family protein [Rugosimonospora africana]|uniref:Glyoxalase n=1 Tax=Rugosimonospora africana TaxID=556532 RepID=A0A8J3QNS6_9ACTN|nr:VOC family protein [Rugosimonospora africana]GIH12922.1 glyoxalase [Rugosimonospora africana]